MSKEWTVTKKLNMLKKGQRTIVLDTEAKALVNKDGATVKKKFPFSTIANAIVSGNKVTVSFRTGQRAYELVFASDSDAADFTKELKEHAASAAPPPVAAMTAPATAATPVGVGGVGGGLAMAAQLNAVANQPGQSKNQQAVNLVGVLGGAGAAAQVAGAMNMQQQMLANQAYMNSVSGGAATGMTPQQAMVSPGGMGVGMAGGGAYVMTMPTAMTANPAVLEPVDGVSLDDYAKATALLSHKKTKEEMVAEMGWDMAKWEKVDTIWKDRMGSDVAVAGAFGQKFMAAGGSTDVGEKKDPGPIDATDPVHGIDMERYAELIIRLDVNPRDNTRLILEETGLTTEQWGEVQLKWQTRQQFEHTRLTVHALKEKHRKLRSQ
eukprot:CAMPEP_0114557856 /NCGR_PEP_ID=MMETSP0114-20121206/10057_1 /TAXON_ID=31324 /ORGANISM="Goniomonas sp, Strain m" /LENGTH=378 /DNA_ID=CAMNT_0001743179 /DNA_START=32 /DNA_END=1168 /DNA_ORIENTATION=-